MRYSSYGRVFQIYYIFKLFFENPYPFQGRLVGRPCLVCFLLKILLNMCMKWVVGIMSYTLDSNYIFNWYHWILSIGINIDILFVYSYMFLYMYTYTSNSINFGCYSIFIHTYIYICLFCAYYISISLSTNF